MAGAGRCGSSPSRRRTTGGEGAWRRRPPRLRRATPGGRRSTWREPPFEVTLDPASTTEFPPIRQTAEWEPSRRRAFRRRGRTHTVSLLFAGGGPERTGVGVDSCRHEFHARAPSRQLGPGRDAVRYRDGGPSHTSARTPPADRKRGRPAVPSGNETACTLVGATRISTLRTIFGSNSPVSGRLFSWRGEEYA